MKNIKISGNAQLEILADQQIGKPQGESTHTF